MEFQPWFGLVVLFIINTINFMDRLSIAAVSTELVDYYKFTSSEAGALSVCFLVGYMCTAPVFGHLGDKYTRKWILVGGILFWCLSAFCGSIIPKDLSALFFLSRMLVGVGEACYSTIAPTIIADLFGPDLRKLALSIFYFAIPIGSGLGYVVGNVALNLNDWRYIFYITPAIGLVSTALLLLLDEPVRGQADGASQDEDDHPTIMENLRYLSGIKSYIWATAGFTGCLYATGALSWWAIQFFGVAVNREYEKTAAIIFGITVCLAGLVGVTIGSSSAKFLRNYDGRADPFVCAAGVFLAIPFTYFGLTFARTSTSFSWVCLFFAVTALSTNWAVVSDMLLSVTLPTRRAFATAIQIFTSHLFGDAASPFITGFIRDVLKGSSTNPDDDYTAFLYSLLSTLPFLILGAIAFLHSANFFVHDVEACKQRLARNNDKREDSTRSEGANLTDFAAVP